MRTSLTRALVAIVALAAPFAWADDHHLTAADYLEFEEVRDPQVSPDGEQIVYTRRWVDARADAWNSSLWIMDADGSRHRFLIDGSNARWSPSGDRLLFIAPDEHGRPQVFVRWMDAEGAVSQVTRVDVRPTSPQWSPDGESIAFVAIVPADDGWSIDLPAPPEGASWTKAPRILDRLHYRQDHVGYTDPGFSHLFVVPASSGTARQLTDGEWNVGARFDGLYRGAGLDWTPDGEHIVFDGWKADDGDLVYRRSHLYSIAVDSGEITQLTTETGDWTSPVVSGDGERIAFLGYPDSEITYELPRIHVMERDGSDVRLLSEDFDRPADQLIWDARDRGVYFTAQDEGYVNVFHLALDGDLRAVTEGRQVITLESVDDDVATGVGVRADFEEPGDVHRFALGGRGSPERLTAVNADLLDGRTLGEQKEIRFTAEDGNRAHGWIITPPDFDPEVDYPMIMEIHGGPFAMYRGAFDFEFQAFAAAGYVVLYTNPRGSTGYGEAFSQAIDRAYPSVDYLDLMAGVDAAVAEGYVDTDRMYVGGCSGGGVLSSWVIGHTDRFAAAAVRCPVSNWLSMAGQTDIPGFTFSFFDEPFWEDPDEWLEHSSLMHVGKVSTPTIVMTGEQDLRTPMPQSEEYYAALKMRGVPAKLLRFNDQYHGTGTKPSNAMRTILYMLDWYGQWTEDGRVEADGD
jgi:dipeptidyl aminopeptidase/acylaminoacyl peptidase